MLSPTSVTRGEGRLNDTYNDTTNMYFMSFRGLIFTVQNAWCLLYASNYFNLINI